MALRNRRDLYRIPVINYARAHVRRGRRICLRRGFIMSANRYAYSPLVSALQSCSCSSRAVQPSLKLVGSR